uniref:Mesothelin a n=1 Tax=Poecilia formosa TaxID=48698 RepID=A0A087Y5F7_POEFO
PAVSEDFLSCVATESLVCSTYQYIVKTLSELHPVMLREKQLSVFTHFITVYLTTNNTAGPGCLSSFNNSAQWLTDNFGPFSEFVIISELIRLNRLFNPLDVIQLLTPNQRVELLGLTPPENTDAVINTLFDYMTEAPKERRFTEFLSSLLVFTKMVRYHVDETKTEMFGCNNTIIWVIKEKLSLQSNNDKCQSAAEMWFGRRLRPFLPAVSDDFLSCVATESLDCSTYQYIVKTLSKLQPHMLREKQMSVFTHFITVYLTTNNTADPSCSSNTVGSSDWLQKNLGGFSVFISIQELLKLYPDFSPMEALASLSVGQLVGLFTIPGLVTTPDEVAMVMKYVPDPMLAVFFDEFSVAIRQGNEHMMPSAVRSAMLEVVFNRANLSHPSVEDSVVSQWLNNRLPPLVISLIPSQVNPYFQILAGRNCSIGQQGVTLLNSTILTLTPDSQKEIYNHIILALKATPRCYDPNHPELNSTAWFAEYIGPFMPFLTLEILQTFGSDQTLQVFTVNPLNIALLNHSVLPQNLTDYYTKLVYQQDSNFHPLLLPMLCRCVAPAMAFTQLTPGESLFVLQNLTIVCQDLDPQVTGTQKENKNTRADISAALTSNLGDDIDSNAISALGNESTSMSKGQIKAIQPQQLVNALFTLSNVMGWNGGQAKSIIESLLTVMQINSASSLFTLGTLIIGVPSRVFRKIQSSEILVASRNPSLVGHMMSSPKIVQQIFVTQILSVNSTGEAIIQNVPDEMATEIPRVFLQSFTAGSVTKLNKKKWKRQQAELFFGVIAMESSTAVLGSANNLSSSVLQGFTCTSVRTIQKAQVKNLVKACRRKGKCILSHQLTCMFNLIRKESDITSFELFPPDVLLYYEVSQSNCRQYFEQLSDADFSVFSSELSYKRTALFDNARSCLGITTTNLTKDQVTVLGNMCCYLSPSYILDSDESILEKLKTCPDLSAAQAAAVETRLIGGTTRYRLAPTWTETTLRNLDTFPLYMSSGFYDNFDQTTKRSFLKYYLKVLKTDGVSRAKIGAMKENIRQSIRSRLKRQAVTECTVGNITQVTISGVTFPFDYSDINQFNSCLSAAVVRDNLEIITQKVDQQDYLKIVLTKLQEAYSTTVPEDQVQILGPASRIASIDQINTWNITEVDTLASLMDTTYGAWDPSLAKAIISKYLSVEGNKLESAELNAIGGPNLCSVDAAVLSNISQLSLKDADALDVSNCTRDKLKVLFSIALQAFQPTSRSNVPLYQLIQPYLVGGAPYNFVQSLVASDVNMDLQTFINLDESVIQSLRVSEVKGLLGNNLADLRSFENTPVVRSWISTRLQSELETLDIGLTGG